MKNNTLHIVYNDSLISQKCGRYKHGIKFLFSYKCNRIDRSKGVVQKISPDVIKEVIWKDKSGKKHSLQEILTFEKDVKSNPYPSNGATRKRFLEKNIATIIEKKKIREKRNK